MEDDLNLFRNGRQPHFFSKMEDDLIFFKMEEDLNFFKKADNLNFFQNGRQHKSFSKWNST